MALQLNVNLCMTRQELIADKYYATIMHSFSCCLLFSFAKYFDQFLFALCVLLISGCYTVLFTLKIEHWPKCYESSFISCNASPL